MEYIEKNYTPFVVVGIGLAAKKLLKKDLVPVSGWKQMLTTYVTVFSAVVISGAIKHRVQENIKPKPA